jgi:hypothetical protein
MERGLCQLLQQPLGRLEIRSAKSLAEPAVALCHEPTGLMMSSPSLPQPAKAPGRAQLMRP